MSSPLTEVKYFLFISQFAGFTFAHTRGKYERDLVRERISLCTSDLRAPGFLGCSIMQASFLLLLSLFRIHNLSCVDRASYDMKPFQRHRKDANGVALRTLYFPPVRSWLSNSRKKLTFYNSFDYSSFAYVCTL